LIRLTRLGFVESFEENNSYQNESWVAYRLTTAGQDWLLDNQDQLEMRLSKSVASPPQPLSETGITDDDLPF
jgi:hypothetical protein